MTAAIMTGTAGWSIPLAMADAFPGQGSHLERYARVMPAVEINSSFHRPHRIATYQRWAAAVPPSFRFSVKLPKAISHTQRLVGADALLDAFALESAGLGEKLEVVLVQLPPSLAFDGAVASAFFADLSSRIAASIACEPRHPSWFTQEADTCLSELRVARVAADPAVVPDASSPGGWTGFSYRRLHGAPQIYRSLYGEDYVTALAASISGQGNAAQRRWCIFDNTASGAATADAVLLRDILAAHQTTPVPPFAPNTLPSV